MRFKKFHDNEGSVISVNMEYATAFYVNAQDPSLVDVLLASQADPAAGTMVSVRYDYDQLCAELGCT